MRAIGYLDGFSYRPGDQPSCMISANGPVTVDIVRLRHGDTNPAGPGFLAEPVPSVAPQTPAVGPQTTSPGSCMIAPLALEGAPADLDLSVWMWPTLPRSGARQGLVALVDGNGATSACVALDGDGHLHLVAGDRVTCRLERPLLARRWYHVRARIGAAGCTLTADPLRPVPGDAGPTRAADASATPLRPTSAAVVAAAAAPVEQGRPRPRDTFNGKLERPAISADGTTLAEWAFEREMATSTTVDISGRGCHGRLVNMPARGMRGRTWTGDVVDHRQDPAQYAAIHFHDDDLADAGWEPAVRIPLPEHLASGTYAVRLRAGDGNAADHVPFVVRPHAPTARVAYLLPSFTYAAYANLQPDDDQPQSRLHPLDLYLRDHPELGKSLYDLHTDGSGVCYSSLARPVVQLRPDYRSWLTGAPRHFGADLYLVDWFEQRGVAYDVLCDHDLHDQGTQLLAGYDVVVTGSHPEYCSRRMLDALEAHVAGGGCLMYLGGNGFYWVTTIDERPPHAVEVRRYGGTRSWEGDPGEQNHSMTGEVGGLWRSRGRPPHALAGIGFTAQGWDAAVGFRRTEAGRDPRWAWVFEGVEGDVFGDAGLVMGGASGDELDRAEPRWGTPPQTVVLATSLPHSGSYYAVVEEVLAVSSDLSGAASPLVRSDMAIVEHIDGGAVFSVGSIAFTGSLSWNGYDNGVSRVVANVLRGFLSRTEGQRAA